MYSLPYKRTGHYISEPQGMFSVIAIKSLVDSGVCSLKREHTIVLQTVLE